MDYKLVKAEIEWLKDATLRIEANRRLIRQLVFEAGLARNRVEGS